MDESDQRQPGFAVIAGRLEKGGFNFEAVEGFVFIDFRLDGVERAERLVEGRRFFWLLAC